MAYTIELSPEEEKVVERRAARLGITPQDYVRHSLSRQFRTGRKVSALALDEIEQQAILALNEQLPASFWQQYAELTQKLRNRTLTENEHLELKQFTAQEEAWNVARLQLLQKMAERRQVSLLEFMKYNQIGHHPDADRFLTEE
ncbi:MAG: hypothetical protein OHK0029_41070 [Armatimonadaceae bacterium]